MGKIPMRIAYLILAHDQPDLFGRLVSAVYADKVTIYAHIDAKVDSSAFVSACADVPVVFVPEPVKVNWGGYSQVAAMLKLLEQAVRTKTHDYYIFLSGRDYPLHSHARICNVLDRYRDRSYMNFYALVDGTDMVNKIRRYCFYDAYARIPTRFFRRVTGRIVREISSRLPARRFLEEMQPYRGSTSWCITHEVAAHIVQFVNDPKNNAYINFFRSVSCSDEIFFQTIVLNSPFAAKLNLYDDDGHRPPGEMKNENKASLHYIDWNPSREDPAILVDSDFNLLYTSGKLFARKFDSKRSASVLDRIDTIRINEGHEEQSFASTS